MNVLIAIHNLMRWVIIALALFVLFRAYTGWFGKKAFLDLDRKAGVFFGAAMDTQMLLGIILWIFGEWGWKVLGTANSQFFAIEHTPSMILAVVLAHVASIKTKKAAPEMKHKTAALWFSASIIVVLLSIPWAQRALFPGF